MMMYYDHVESVYLTDKELKKVPARLLANREDIRDGNNHDAVMKAVIESELNPE
jgi:hypothetical protein